MATVLIPTPLRKFTGNMPKISISGDIIAEIINNMVAEYPDVQRYLLDQNGAVRPFINIFVDQDDIRGLQSQSTAVDTHSVISIVPAIAGGNIDAEEISGNAFLSHRCRLTRYGKH